MHFHFCFGQRIYIDVFLDVYPCVMERRLLHGSLKDHELSEIIDAEGICKLRKDDVDECKFCEYRYACFDCRPNAKERGFHDKPWNCTYSPCEGVWIDRESFINSLLS